MLEKESSTETHGREALYVIDSYGNGRSRVFTLAIAGWLVKTTNEAEKRNDHGQLVASNPMPALLAEIEWS